MPPQIGANWTAACRQARRWLVNGPPYSGKTTGLLLTPAPRCVLVAPGELGWTSIPPDDPETKLIWWELEPGKDWDYGRVHGEFVAALNEALTGKHGVFKTIAIDGLHKYAELAMYALGWTPAQLEREDGARAYPKYYAQILNLVNRCACSRMENFAATCYDGKEQAEDSAGNRMRGQTNIWPEMPGKLAKLILGSFPLCFHAERRPGNPQDRFYWRLRPSGNVQGCGAHFPPAFLRHLPDEVEIKLDKATGKLSGGWQDIEAILQRLSMPAGVSNVPG